MEIKQYISKEWTSYWRNKKEKKILGTNDNESMMTQNLWNEAKAVIRGMLIAIKSYLMKQYSLWIENLASHLKQLEKEEKFPPHTSKNKQTENVSRRKELIKIRVGINEKEINETIVNINKTKNWFLEKTNKFDKAFAKLIRKK